jgi:hypothetical protein
MTLTTRARETDERLVDGDLPGDHHPAHHLFEAALRGDLVAKYSVKLRSPLPLLLFAAGLVATYFLRSESWGGYAIAGIAAGFLTSAVSRNAVIRTFEPTDASPEDKKMAVVVLTVFRLLFAAFILLIGAFALAHWLAPAFDYAGGFVIGGTAITPLRERDFA